MIFLDLIRSVLDTAILGERSWSETLATTVYLQNKKLLDHFQKSLLHIAASIEHYRNWHLRPVSVEINVTKY